MIKRALILLFILAGLIVEFQFEIDVLKSDLISRTSRPFVPPAVKGVKLMAMGYHTLIADMYWLRTIQYQAGCDDRNEFPGDLYAMADFITDLDPQYHLVYFFTGLELIMKTGDKEQIISILKKGEKNCPHYWKLPFLLGFYYYMALNDYESAASQMEQAYKEHPHWNFAMLAARIRAQGGSPELGIKFLRQMMQQTRNKKNIRLFTLRIKQLELTLLERNLTRLADQYRQSKGEYPAGLEDLVAAGLIKQIPASPLPGYRLVYDPAAGTVSSDPALDLKVHNPWAQKSRKRRSRPGAQGGK